ITRSGMTQKAIEELVNRQVEEALAAYEVTRVANSLEAENQSQNGSDSDNGNEGNENGGNGNPNRIIGMLGLLLEGRAIGTEALFAMSWKELIKLMAKVYCLRNKIRKMESELWSPRRKIGLRNSLEVSLITIQGNVIATEPMRLQDAVRIANNLMDQNLNGYAVKNAKNKKRLEVNQRDNSGPRPPFKRPNVRGQNVAKAYMAGNNERKPYNGSLPLCNKCKLHHEWPYIVRCGKCNKDQNHGNKAGNKNGVGEAREKAYVLGGGDANLDSNAVLPFLLARMGSDLTKGEGVD
nr:hypothetical protein [Tanacetum cinerariifolium]